MAGLLVRQAGRRGTARLPGPRSEGGAVVRNALVLLIGAGIGVLFDVSAVLACAVVFGGAGVLVGVTAVIDWRRNR